MNQNQVIALNVDGNLLTKLAELLGGEVAEQVKGALAAQGIVVPESVKAEPVKAEPELAFGAYIDSDTDNGWKGSYNVKGATSLSVQADEEGNIVISGTDADGEECSIDTFYADENDATANTVAWVEGDTLFVAVPTVAKAVEGQEFDVAGFNEPSDEQEPDEDNFCQECQEYHS
jgi:hypothetical protein